MPSDILIKGVVTRRDRKRMRRMIVVRNVVIRWAMPVVLIALAAKFAFALELF